MRQPTIFILLWFAALNCYAQDRGRPPSTTAARLAEVCSSVTDRVNRSETAAVLCVATISSYVEGWRDGGEWGSRIAFFKDDANFKTIKDGPDYGKRMEAILPQIYCLDGSSFGAIEEFMKYVRENPSRLGDPYSEVLRDLFSKKLCVQKK